MKSNKLTPVVVYIALTVFALIAFSSAQSRSADNDFINKTSNAIEKRQAMLDSI